MMGGGLLYGIWNKTMRVMALGYHFDAVALRKQDDRWQLEGERVPIVSEYRHLGGLIISD
jgi:hypothetical protein